MPNVIGHVDGLEGQSAVGWAIAEPDTAACSIEVCDENGVILGQGRATRHRSDLGSLSKGRTDFAFTVPIRLGTAKQIHVLADGTELGGSPIPVGPGYWDGVLFIADGRAQGWVSQRCPPGYPAPVVEIFDHDGATLGNAKAVFKRPADSSGELAMFDITLPMQCYGKAELFLSAAIDDQTFAHATGSLRLDGFLDILTPTHCAGWLLSPDAPTMDFDVSVYLNKQFYKTVTSNEPRDDLRASYPVTWRKGFDLRLNSPEFLGSALEISLRLADTEIELFDGPFVIGDKAACVDAARRIAVLAHSGSSGLSVWERAIAQDAMREYIKGRRFSDPQFVLQHSEPAAAMPQQAVTIIIPVYRGIETTRDCIESVLRHRPESPASRLVIVNDCSPEPGMRDMLRAFEGRAGVVLITNHENLGFIRSVNRAIRTFSGSDVVLLNSDTRVFAGWLEGLVAAAYSAPSIGTVTPLSNNATIFSYPHPMLSGDNLPDATWDELATVARYENSGTVIDVPTGHGFCLYIKSCVLRQVGILDEKYGRGYGEENDLCCRAGDFGYRNVAAASVFVEHRESVSFGSERALLWERNRPILETSFPEYTPQIMAYERRDELRKARWALDRYRLEKASHEIDGGFCLIITNWLGGGSDTAIRDLRNSAPAQCELVLTAQENGYFILTAAHPRISALFSPTEEDELFGMLRLATIDSVACHQLLGFPERFIRKLSDWVDDKRSMLYLHDFYPFCPRVNLIDAANEFCGVPDIAVCERCVKTGGTHEANRLQLSVAAQRQLFQEISGHFARIISPSENTAGYFARVFPGLPISVVPHPQSLWTFPSRMRAGDGSNIVLLGAIGPHKGSQALLEIAGRARLTHPHLHFHVIGYTNIDKALLGLGNVSITGKYQPEELPELVSRTGGRIALFLHGWPETFSYALTEAVALGLLPMVPDIGAPADRIRRTGYGVVFPFPFDTTVVLTCIQQVANTPSLPSSPGRFDALASDSSGSPRTRLFEIEEISASVLDATNALHIRKPSGKRTKHSQNRRRASNKSSLEARD